MSRYRLSSSGEWIRLNQDGSEWNITEEDEARRAASLGREPQPYRLSGSMDGSVPRNSSNDIDKLRVAECKPLPDKQTMPALGTDIDLPLPECYVPLPMPLRYLGGAHRIVELRSDHMAYKSQYRFYRQYIDSPQTIIADRDLNCMSPDSAFLSEPKIYRGKLGGRYSIVKSKQGHYYRKYF